MDMTGWVGRADCLDLTISVPPSSRVVRGDETALKQH